MLNHVLPVKQSIIVFLKKFSKLQENIKEAKANINKCDDIKIKSSCTTKKTINKMRMHHMKWEKMLLIYYISQVYNELIQVNTKKTIIPLKMSRE